MESLLNRFKKQSTSVERKVSSEMKEIFIQLNFDDMGCSIKVVDAKKNEVDFEYQNYDGSLRNLLRAIQKLDDRSDFFIDWENPQTKIYLHQNDFLLEYLRHCKNIVDERGKKVVFTNKEGFLKVIIKADADMLTSQVFVDVDGGLKDDFLLMNEEFVMVDGEIIQVEEVGEAFNQVLSFDTTLRQAELPTYLSLLFSYIDNVRLDYQGYAVHQSPEKIVAVPCLVFEKIDADDALHVRITQELPNTSVDFLEEFELYRFADVNELEQIIYVKEISRRPLQELIDKVVVLVEKNTPKERGKKKPIGQFIVDNNLLVIPAELAGPFIYQELPNLLETFKLYGSEKLKQYKISNHPPRLDLQISHGIDFLEGDASISFGDDKFSLFEVLRQYQQNKYIQLSDGSHALVNEGYIQKLERIFSKVKKDKVRLSFFDLPIIEELIDERLAEATFKKSRDFFTGFNGLKDIKPKLPKVKAKLRGYQERGVQWMNYLHDSKLNGCLADDMGLGKTLQTITLLTGFYPKEKKPTLIVMPKTLLFNWQREVEKFNPSLSFYVYYANTRDLDEACKSNLIFTTYAMMRNDIEKFQEKEFFYVILDESQNIKNMQSQASKAVLLLNSEHRLALSGTPIENNLGELYSLFRFLNPAMFGTTEAFNNNYLIPIQKSNDAEAVKELRKKIYPFILRRLKKDVLTELPDKIEQVLYIEMSEAQKKFYEARRLFYKDQIEKQIQEKGVENSQFYIFQAFNELRQIASIPEAKTNDKIESPKIESLIEQISDASANGHKSLVFVNYLAALEKIGEELDNQGIDYVSMSGSTRDRQALVERFQNDSNCRVFLMTLKTGGTGLNLTAADMVFIFDPWWNKAAENQAIDRSHRFGQTKKVMAYKMITQGSIEEKILQLQEKKAELFNAIISSDSASLKSFSENDIQFMLG